MNVRLENMASIATFDPMSWRVIPCGLYLVFLLFCEVLLAEEKALDASAESNVEILWRGCQLCHSTIEMQRGPMIEGLPQWYLHQQLEKFSKGIRGKLSENKSEWLMGSAIKQFGDSEDWPRLAAYIANLPALKPLRTVRGNHEKGKALYAMCASCHGPMAKGNQVLGAPPLNVQEDWYLREQLMKYRSSMRGYHPQDLGGATMRAVASSLTNEQIKNIVFYLSSLQKPPKGRVPSKGQSHSRD